MVKVCFVIPKDEFNRSFMQLPLDAVNAAAVLRQAKVSVFIWDQRLTVKPEVNDINFAVIITAIADRAQCYPLDLTQVQATVERVRRRWPEAILLACGPHGTNLPEATLRELGVDIVVRGESDSASISAMRKLLADWPVTQVLPPAGKYPEADVATWPLPAYDLLDLSAYTAEVIVEGRVSRESCGLILAARGCTYCCTYCHLPFGTAMRTQPTARALAEVAALKGYGIGTMFFLDYVFGLQKEFYKELCAGLATLDVQWIGQTRAEVVLHANVNAWVAAGCNGMWLGAESPGVAHTGVGKRIGTDKINFAIDKLADAGITPFTFILLGLPDDPACRSGEIVDWAASLPGYFGLNQLVLRPGTSLYNRLAPTYCNGQMPRTWAEVKMVTRNYRKAYPSDLNEQQQQLAALPNYLDNALLQVHRNL